MRKIFLLAVLLAAVTLLCGCVTQKRCDRKFPPVIEYRDSIHEVVVIKYKDTVIHDTIPGEEVTVYLDSPCPDGKPMKDRAKKLELDNEWVRVYSEIKYGRLQILIEKKPVVRDYKFQQIYAEKLKEHFSKRSEVVIVEDKFIPWYIYAVIIALIITNLLQLLRR